MRELAVAVVGSEGVARLQVGEGLRMGEIKKKLAEKLGYRLPPSGIRLFLAKLGDGEWLAENGPELAALRQLPTPQDSPYLVSPLNMSFSVRRCVPLCEANEGVVHILAIVPARTIDQVEASVAMSPRPLKKGFFKTPWTATVDKCPRLDFNAVPDFVDVLCIPSIYLDKAGVRSVEGKNHLWLYRRRALKELWSEMEWCCLRAQARLLIFGPPGVGKTCAAFSFACGGIDRSKWNVLWVHFSGPEENSMRCVKFDGDTKSTCALNLPLAAEDVFDLLVSSTNSERGLFVFLDGCRGENAHLGISQFIATWQSNDPARYRLICLMSVSPNKMDYNPHNYMVLETPSGNPSRQNPAFMSVVQFRLVSWRLEEYLAAVAHRGLFESVMGAFGVSQSEAVISSASRLHELVKEKHHVAGGCARAMFVFSSDTVETTLEQFVTRMGHPELHHPQHADYYASTVGYRLLAVYDDGNENKAVFRGDIVSSYASKLLAKSLRPEELVALPTRTVCGLSMDGWLFKAWLISSLRYGFKFRHKFDVSTVNAWEGKPVRDFDQNKPFNACAEGFFVPTTWGEAGYDAIRICRDKMRRLHVVILQATCAKVHAFDPNSLVELLNMVRGTKQWVVSVELWFVVPESILDEFHYVVSPCDPYSFQLKVEADFAELVAHCVGGKGSLAIKARVRPVSVEYPYFAN